jgi:cytosine deaminase
MRDIAVSDGRIVDGPSPDVDQFDGKGLLVLPRLADIHLHLDKTLLGERWFPHQPAETIEERARMEQQLLESDLVAPLQVRATRLIEQAVENGTTLLQSHVDVGDTISLGRVETLLRLAEEYADLVDLALVAFPQAGLLRNRDSRQALDTALALGAEAVGGLDPVAFDGDRDAHLDAIFELAEKHECRLDVHLHESGRTGTATIRAIAERARVLGFVGRCVVSHGYALAQVDDVELGLTASAMAEAEVSLVTSVPGDGRLPPLARLRELGVNAIVASDNVRDAWSPFGNADQVARAALAAYCSNWRADPELAETLHLVTINPATALGRPQALLRPGDPGDFTLLPAENLSDALVTLPRERLVVRGGRIVARNGALLQAARGSSREFKRSGRAEPSKA